MTRVSSHLPSLIGGVSQQSPALRLSSQCESMVNWYPSPVDGLVKRPPTELVARLDVAPTAPLLYHLIERDERERYHVVISEGRVRVWTLEGEERPVKGGEDSYLDVADPQRDLRVITSQDYTFILNVTVRVEESEKRFPERAHEALVFIKQGVASTTYTVSINAQSYSYSLPDDSASIASVTANLASQLSGAGYSVVYDRSVILVRHSSAFTLKVSDSKGGSCIDSFTNRTQSFSSLPAIAADGFILEISGDSGTGYDNHFVRFETDSGEVMDKGVWVECPKPGSTRGFRASTCPAPLSVWRTEVLNCNARHGANARQAMRKVPPCLPLWATPYRISSFIKIVWACSPAVTSSCPAPRNFSAFFRPPPQPCWIPTPWTRRPVPQK